MENYYDDRTEAWQESDRAAEIKAQTELFAEALASLDELLT